MPTKIEAYSELFESGELLWHNGTVPEKNALDTLPSPGKT
jgi:hypothetical protein